MISERIISADEALRLAEYQRPGVKLIVGPELAREVQMPPLPRHEWMHLITKAQK